MNINIRLLLVLLSLTLWQCEEVVDGLAGIETPVEIEDDAPPLVNPVDPGNPNRYIPNVAFSFSPDISANGGVISENALSVTATVTNASENPDPNVFQLVYEYTLTSEYGEVGQRSSNGTFSESQFDFARLDEGQYTLVVRYRLQQSSTSQTLETTFIVDKYPGSGVIFLQNPSFESASQRYFTTIWVENIVDVRSAKIVVNYPSDIFEFDTIENTRSLSTPNAILPSQELLFLVEETSPGILTLNLGALSSAGNINGTGSIARLALRAKQSANDSPVRIDQQTTLRNDRNGSVTVNNFGEVRIGN